MIAWARHQHATGRTEQARWLVQRLREFRNPDAAEFLSPCETPGATAWQCQPPRFAHGWREFVGRGWPPAATQVADPVAPRNAAAGPARAAASTVR
jgi:hypothetical protein